MSTSKSVSLIWSDESRAGAAPAQRAVTPAPSAAEGTVSILVLTCAYAGAEPLGAALQRRSSSEGVYAQQFPRYQRGRQPAAAAAYAALSLHAPFPVLHVLSRVPLRQTDQVGAYSSLQPTYVNPTYAQPAYAQPPYAHPYPYAAQTTSQLTYDINSDTDEPILFARPNPRGGYIYRRRRPIRRRTPAPAAARPAEPLIIRVHKYKVVRDR
ncbi:hypothetical protein ACJJTC_000169 [Scirpophaga incertulas]